MTTPVTTDEQRKSRVDAARREWINRLIDLSRRNNLLYFRDLTSGTLDLDDADPEELQSLLVGQKVRLSVLLKDSKSANVTTRIGAIHRTARENLEERGLHTLHVAIGMATWPADDGGRPPEAPVLLLPVRIELTPGDRRSATLQAVGEPQLNLALIHVLATRLDRAIDEAEILAARSAPHEDHSAARITPDWDAPAILAKLVELAASIEGFAINRDRHVLGNFSFQKMAMVRDLKRYEWNIAQHNLIAAIAGDVGARQQLTTGRTPVDERAIDARPPERDFTVLNADSSQTLVLERALVGQDGVIQGPPGTGKSQTIANLIASLVSEGKRVLFVAEKRAALEAVMKRLSDPAVGLDRLLLDLHGAEATRARVMTKIRSVLKLVREDARGADCSAVHEPFSKARERLNAQARRMHAPRHPAGVSLYELMGATLRTPESLRVKTRWRGADLARLDAAAARKAAELLNRAGAHADLFLGRSASPWNRAALADASSARRGLDLATELTHVDAAALEQSLTAFAASAGANPPDTPAKAGALFVLLSDIAEFLNRYKPAVFDLPHAQLADQLRQADDNVIVRTLASLFNGRYRTAKRTLREVCTDATADDRRLRADAKRAGELMQRWQAFAIQGALPNGVTPESALRDGVATMMSQAKEVSTLAGAGDLTTMRFADAVANARSLAADEVSAVAVPVVRAIASEAEAIGLAKLIDEIRTGNIPARYWRGAFEYAWRRSCIDLAFDEDPELASFAREKQDRLVEEFQLLDRTRLKLNAARVREMHAACAIKAMDEHPEQDQLVRREAEKKARHLPLRELLKRAPNVMTALCPCWMASPLSVSHLLDADRAYFDYVIFDEASQVLPEDAVTAILRGTRLIVAGDQHQLPPTQFFADGSADSDAEVTGDDAEGIKGFESILDIVSTFLEPWMLRWHYRSRDERLIAFSNRHVYDNRMVTFPGASGERAVSHTLVNQPLGRDEQEDSVGAEVERVVELVLNHAQQRPRESLGVIAMGIRHADRIEALLDRRLAERPDLSEFFRDDREERFFVKNLERVQGDEREAIILSVGYGKDRAGNLPHRFGPLNMEGGHRRLNVAVTRARRRMAIVSSFAHTDVDPARCKARGAELLRSYLEYATSGGDRLGDKGLTDEPLNPFEADVSDALTAAGLKLLPQYGVGQYRIDFVAQDVDTPGRLVLAIECDGASYHSTPSARDRDRLRQEHLETLGWKFHRIWSADWFLRREAEIARTVNAYRAALRDGVKPSTAEPAAVPAPSATNDTAPPAAPARQGPRPRVPKDVPIDERDEGELVAMLRWIESDGLNRTRDELVDEMIEHLGYARRGPRIVERIGEVIDRHRAR